MPVTSLLPSCPALDKPLIKACLYCLHCGKPHVDRGEWATRIHRTHLCEHCGKEWSLPFHAIGVLMEDLENDPVVLRASCILLSAQVHALVSQREEAYAANRELSKQHSVGDFAKWVHEHMSWDLSKTVQAYLNGFSDG